MIENPVLNGEIKGFAERSPDQLSPDDLEMIRDMQQQIAPALAIQQFTNQLITKRYNIGPQDQIQLDTGKIVRGSGMLQAMATGEDDG